MHFAELFMRIYATPSNKRRGRRRRVVKEARGGRGRRGEGGVRSGIRGLDLLYNDDEL